MYAHCLATSESIFALIEAPKYSWKVSNIYKLRFYTPGTIVHSISLLFPLNTLVQRMISFRSRRSKVQNSREVRHGKTRGLAQDTSARMESAPKGARLDLAGSSMRRKNWGVRKRKIRLTRLPRAGRASQMRSGPSVVRAGAPGASPAFGLVAAAEESTRSRGAFPHVYQKQLPAASSLRPETDQIETPDGKIPPRSRMLSRMERADKA